MGFPGGLGSGKPVSHLAGTGPAVDHADDAVDGSGGILVVASASSQAAAKADHLSISLVELDSFTEEPVEVLDGFKALLLGDVRALLTSDLVPDVMGVLLRDHGEAVSGCEPLDSGHGGGGSGGTGLGHPTAPVEKRQTDLEAGVFNRGSGGEGSGGN